jgi:hypothetical protein
MIAVNPDTVAALVIEPLGFIICGRCKPEIPKHRQVFSPQMIDPSGAIISAPTCRYSMSGSMSSTGLRPDNPTRPG